MAIESFELVEIQGQEITVDLLIWRRYRRRAPGMFEAMMDLNPDIARAHKHGPFLPVGLQVRIPIDRAIMDGEPITISAVNIFGTVT